ncbi:MAG: LL-diaminopimelate aminotransferase [Thermodesulfobacteriota bacterium]|nr:LL-diaminopimelate aminotransferase [Thermodesulfobacteriota bacterium]
MFELAERIKKLPPYLFKDIDRKMNEMTQKGVDIINLGIGDPDLPTPMKIIDSMIEAIKDHRNHHYPSYSGMDEFISSIGKWYDERFSVSLNPENEILALIGAKEGVAHLPLAFINPGDLVLITSPSYPVYNSGTLFAGGEPYFLPLTKENDFMPDLASIPDNVKRKAKMLWLNYPNNPTSAVATKDFFENAVNFAHKNNILICHDLTYSEVAFDNYKPISLLEIEGAKDVCIEFHSLSKTYNMTGWRIGFAVGNKEAIRGLGLIKSNIDSGIFQAIQIAGIEALRLYRESAEEIKNIYTGRRDVMVQKLKESGFTVSKPKATFYLWVPVPHSYTSASLAARLLTEAGVVVTPGNGFGQPGEGYIRLALTQKEDRLIEAADRIKNIGL